MKNNLRLFSVTFLCGTIGLTSCASLKKSSEPSLRTPASDSSFGWKPDLLGRINCVESTEDGRFIRTAELDSCRKLFGIHVSWRNDSIGRMNCIETTPDGQSVQTLEIEICRKQLGSRFAWKEDALGRTVCAEVTPAGQWIQATGNPKLCTAR